ncbi:MAG TPA: hypothetical protein VMW36_02535 [Patescibacteria group bacterium]|nr:hypothetical protein [Patescibacteria group bacterium]
MPIQRQIKKIKEILRAANPNLSDYDFLPISGNSWEHAKWGDSGYEEWTEHLDPTATLPENLDDLERYFSPTIRWKVKKQPAPSKPRRFYKVDIGTDGTKGEFGWIKAIVIVRPHPVRAKGKDYLRGRIQLTVDKDLVGERVKVLVKLPNSYVKDYPQRMMKRMSEKSKPPIERFRF